MQKLSITEFEKLCREIAPVTFIFDTDNQKNMQDIHMKIVAKYSQAIFMLNPDRIYFSEGNNKICFDAVKEIRYERWGDKSWEFKIICKDWLDERDIAYTILADKFFLRIS